MIYIGVFTNCKGEADLLDNIYFYDDKAKEEVCLDEDFFILFFNYNTLDEWKLSFNKNSQTPFFIKECPLLKTLPNSVKKIKKIIKEDFPELLL